VDVLLAIKPRYVESIFGGAKKYEFRKVCFRLDDISNAYIYSTSPTKKIVGKFRIGRIVKDHPTRLWNRFGDKSGMSLNEFFEYFYYTRRGVAIEILDVEAFAEPIDPFKMFEGFVAPQSFMYWEH
jgi:predicted transcriptional regulator